MSGEKWGMKRCIVCQWDSLWLLPIKFEIVNAIHVMAKQKCRSNIVCFNKLKCVLLSSAWKSIFHTRLREMHSEICHFSTCSIRKSVRCAANNFVEHYITSLICTVSNERVCVCVCCDAFISIVCPLAKCDIVFEWKFSGAITDNQPRRERTCWSSIKTIY